MYTQEFTSEWPAVLAEMLEFIVLTQLSFGRARAAIVNLSLSRDRVAANQLQPHVAEFRKGLSHKVPGARLTLLAGHHGAHRVEIRYEG